MESSTDVCNAVWFSFDEIPANEDSVGTALTGKISICGVSVRGKPADEGPNMDDSASEPFPSECSAVTSCTGDGSAGRHSIGEVSVGGASIAIASVGEGSGSELSGGKVSTGGGSFGGVPVDRASNGGYSVGRFPGEDSIAEISSGKASAGELSAGETPIGK